jgi:L-asparaginase II
MMAHPELVAGEHRRLDTTLMRLAPGAVVSKGGAEGLSAVGVLAGHAGGGGASGAIGLAIKVEDGDGARRAGSVATLAALQQLGVLEDGAIDRAAEYAQPTIRDPRGNAVGEVRPAFHFA